MRDKIFRVSGSREEWLAALARNAPLDENELTEEVARKLYACEAERSAHTDAVISAAKGKIVTVGMEPWEECWQVFYDDARAVIPIAQAPILAQLAELTEARDFYAGLYAHRCGQLVEAQAQLTDERRKSEALAVALADCADDLEAEVEARRGTVLDRTMERDLASVKAARAALATHRGETDDQA